MVLDKIHRENDVKQLNEEELEQLAEEIRQFLIETLAVTGGHLGSNLGVIELTIALHLVLDLPKDKLIWDVGHQSYTHKILTGRREAFSTLRKYGGLSGFPKPSESSCDSFVTGHSSTSISAGLGMAMAREITGEDYHVISVIGDGALTGGLAYEALNNASQMKKNFIIVLNDNNMSISENVGGMNRYLTAFRTADSYRSLKNNVMNSLKSIPVYGERMVRGIRNAKSSVKQLFVPGMLFEELGIIYLGPVDGHDIQEMRRILEEAKRVDGPVLVHVLTKKGNGFSPAEKHPARFHGAEPYLIDTGLPRYKRTKANYTDVFATVMHKLADRNPKVVAITAAMADGAGFHRFKNMYPDRFFDVGIAEEHAVTFGAGLAASGLIPIFAVYSTFLQRAFDQILHDVCIQRLPMIFAIDRAGLVGSDGETHQGIFDISYLSQIPGMTVMAPKNKWELSDMMKFAVRLGAPAAIRYPRGIAYDGLKEYRAEMELGKAEVIFRETGILLFALGSMVKTALLVHELLAEEGIGSTLVNARFAMPFDRELLRELSKDHNLVVTMEENVASGGFGEHVAAFLKEEEIDIGLYAVAVPDRFVPHGSVDILMEELGMDPASIVEGIRERV